MVSRHFTSRGDSGDRFSRLVRVAGDSKRSEAGDSSSMSLHALQTTLVRPVDKNLVQSTNVARQREHTIVSDGYP